MITFMEQIIIVDKNDVVIGTKARADVSADDIYRSSALWITDQSGNILLAQRSFNKSHDAGKWGPAVAGTNAERESYEQNIMKEAAEEIGLKLKNPKKLAKKFFKNDTESYFAQWFTTVIRKNETLKPQKEEVEELGWFSREDLQMLLKEMPDMFVDSAQDIWPELFLADNI